MCIRDSAIDEGWWSSVLAEEGRSSAHLSTRGVGGGRTEVREEAKMPPVEKKASPNWNQVKDLYMHCLLYTSPSPRDRTRSRMPSSA